jgi:hypothetical protein
LTISPLAASTLHLDLMTARVAAFHLPEAVVELDFLNCDDAPGEGHVAHVVDGEVLGQLQPRARRPPKG